MTSPNIIRQFVNTSTYSIPLPSFTVSVPVTAKLEGVGKMASQFVNTSTHSIPLPSFTVSQPEIAKLGGVGKKPSPDRVKYCNLFFYRMFFLLLLFSFITSTTLKTSQ